MIDSSLRTLMWCHEQAVGSCHCYCLERSDFEQLLGSLTGVMDMHIGLNLLRKVKEFQNMDEKEMETVAKALTRGHHQDGEFIIKQVKCHLWVVGYVLTLSRS